MGFVLAIAWMVPSINAMSDENKIRKGAQVRGYLGVITIKPRCLCFPSWLDLWISRVVHQSLYVLL